MGHVLMENRNGLVVDHRLSISTGTAEPEAAVEMVNAIPGSHRITVGMDKGYDRASCVKALRDLKATPHVAQRKKGSAVDGRTTHGQGYAISQRVRKRVEEIFGWAKNRRGTSQDSFPRGRSSRMGFTLALTAYNLVRIRNLTIQGRCDSNRHTEWQDSSPPSLTCRGSIDAQKREGRLKDQLFNTLLEIEENVAFLIDIRRLKNSPFH